MVAGVYLIVNKRTGQKYAGGSIDIERRIKEHINRPNNSSYIDNAIQKYGFDSFDWQVIEELPADWEIIGDREKYWISFYNTFEDPENYNLTKGGEGISGWRHPEETRKKISESFKGTRHTPEARKKISENHVGMLGKKHTPESRKKMSENTNNSGKNNPFYNQKHSEESRKKMSESHKGKEISKETRKKMSESQSQERNTTGYYRVSKKNCNTCKQGFRYRYSYYDIGGKRHQINSVSLEKLEKKVKNAGLPWKILDEEKARKTLNEA